MSESSIVWFSTVSLEKREQGKRVWFLVVNDLRLKSDLHFENNQKNGIMVGKDSANTQWKSESKLGSELQVAQSTALRL